MARHCKLCKITFPTRRAHNDHQRDTHSRPKPPPPKSKYRRHPHLTGVLFYLFCNIPTLRSHPLFLARPCDVHGNFLPPHAPPPLRPDDIDWHPFPDRPSFEFAEWSFEEAPLSKEALRRLFRILAAKHTVDGLPDYDPIYKTQQDILDTIDAITYGEVSWRTLAIRYRGPLTADSPLWKRHVYLVHTRDALRVVENLVSSSELDGKFDYVPYEEFTGLNCRRVSDFMSGRWAFKQAVCDAFINSLCT